MGKGVREVKYLDRPKYPVNVSTQVYNSECYNKIIQGSVLISCELICNKRLSEYKGVRVRAGRGWGGSKVGIY